MRIRVSRGYISIMKRITAVICSLAIGVLVANGQTALQNSLERSSQLSEQINKTLNSGPKVANGQTPSMQDWVNSLGDKGQAQKFGFNDAPLDVGWVGDHWSVSWVKGDKYVPMERPFRTSMTFPASTIKLYWEKGYSIGLIKNDGIYFNLPQPWAVSFFKGNVTGQGYKSVRKDAVQSELKSLVSAGKRIRAVEYVDYDEEILIVYEDGKGEVASCTWSNISQYIKSVNDKGWRVHSIAQAGELWVGGLLGSSQKAYQLLLIPKNGAADDVWGKAEDEEYMWSKGYVGVCGLMHGSYIGSVYTRDFGVLYRKISNDEVVVESQRVEVVSGKGSLVSPFTHEDQVKTSSSSVKGAASAVVIDALNGFLVTNYHVVEGASNLSIIFQSIEYDVTVVATDDANDLALLRIQGSVPQGLSSLPISINDGLGDDIVTAGYPLQSVLGDDIKVTEGIISSTSYLGGSNMYQHSAPITNGSSGGALLDRQGNLAGITQGGYRPDANTENVNAAVKSLMILSLIQGESDCDVIVGDENQSISFSELFRSVVAVKVR